MKYDHRPTSEDHFDQRPARKALHGSQYRGYPMLVIPRQVAKGHPGVDVMSHVVPDAAGNQREPVSKRDTQHRYSVVNRWNSSDFTTKP